jgi:hypothetical protein
MQNSRKTQKTTPCNIPSKINISWKIQVYENKEHVLMNGDDLGCFLSIVVDMLQIDKMFRNISFNNNLVHK